MWKLMFFGVKLFSDESVLSSISLDCNIFYLKLFANIYIIYE